VDIASIQATRVFQGIARCNAALIDLSEVVRLSPEVTAVVRGLDFRGYQTGTVIEGYVDAELTSGKAICGWLEVRWTEEHWIIETRVLVNDATGQRTYKEFAERAPQTLDDFLVQLNDATSNLVGFLGGVDFKEV